MERQTLTIAILGRKGSGKTSLVRHLSAALCPDVRLESMPRRVEIESSLSMPSNSNRPRRSKLGRFIRSKLSLVRCGIRDVFSADRGEGLSAYSVHELPAPRDSTLNYVTWNIVDVTGPRGVGELAQHVCPDIVLYVTRLDESRASKLDYVYIRDMYFAFGEGTIRRMIIVLTHGQSITPINLTYDDYVRGRRDALWRYVSLVVPPIPRQDLGTSTPEPSRAQVNHGAMRADTPAACFAYSVSGLRELYARNNVDMCRPEDIVDDDILFDDPPPPEIVVVELSEYCARNDTGMKVLPDGSIWMTDLLCCIDQKVESCIDENTKPLKSCIYRAPSAKIGVLDMLGRFAQRGVVILVAEILLAAVALRVCNYWIGFWDARQARIRAGRSDVILELDDEEYRRLTVEDIEPDPRLSDEYEKADEYFFGDEKSPDETTQSPTSQGPFDPPSSSTDDEMIQSEA